MDHELSKATRAKLQLDQISPSACAVKWKHATINLAAGQVKSCCHQSFRKIEVQENSATQQFHETKLDIKERSQMLKGERPSNCRYCWWIEDNGHLSDRSVWSSKSWMAPFIQDVANSHSGEALNPSWMELNFSNVCNLKCSYCSPIFSTSWLREIVDHGPYPTHVPYNVLKNLEGLAKLDSAQQEVLAEKFWPWFETVYSSLRLLKITGGEPLLSPHTLKVFDRIIERPNADLSFSINSNLICPEKVWDDFVSKVQIVRKGKMVSTFYLHPSIDSFGKRAEYIRFGLNFEVFQKHVEDYLEKTGGNLVFICTLNNLSLGGLKDFWTYLLDLKKRFGPRGQEVSVTTELLQNPEWQNLNILPSEFEFYLDETIQFVRKNIGDSKSDFSIFELQGLQRARDIFKNSPEELEKNRADFYRFFTEHDRRRGTSFAETFPELANFFEGCKEIDMRLSGKMGLKEFLTPMKNQIKLQVTLAPRLAEADDREGIASTAALKLTYLLEKTETVQKWIELLSSDLAEKKPLWFDGIFYGRAFAKNKCSEITAELNQTLAALEADSGVFISELRRSTYDLKSLDKIHKLKTELTRLNKSRASRDPLFYIQRLDRLNFLIHRLEVSLTCGAQFAAIVGVPLPPASVPLTPEDSSRFTQDGLFGGLYLDYATNGVEPTDCFRNAIDEKPTPQSEMTSGFQLYFGPDKVFKRKEEFDDWIETRHPDLVANGRPAFGRYLLGRLLMPHDDKSKLQARLTEMNVIQSIEVINAN